MKAIRSYLLHYIYGLSTHSFNGAIAAVCAFLGLAAGHAVVPSIPEIGWKGALSVFLTTYVATALLYFRDHPIPEELPAAEVIAVKPQLAPAPVTAMNQPTPSV